MKTIHSVHMGRSGNGLEHIEMVRFAEENHADIDWTVARMEHGTVALVPWGQVRSVVWKEEKESAPPRPEVPFRQRRKKKR